MIVKHIIFGKHTAVFLWFDTTKLIADLYGHYLNIMFTNLQRILLEPIVFVFAPSKQYSIDGNSPSIRGKNRRQRRNVKQKGFYGNNNNPTLGS